MITCIMSYHIIKLYWKYYFVQKLCALVVLAVAQIIKKLILKLERNASATNGDPARMTQGRT